jgi:lysophospholipase L1-like esterase
MKVRMLATMALGFLTMCMATAQTKNSAVVPEERKGGPADRHAKIAERAKKGNVDVMFLGDSITQGWEGAGKAVWAKDFASWNPGNFGIGGDRTQHVLWRLTEGKTLEGVNPKVCVMMIGTNNAGSNTAEEIAAGVAAIVSELRKQRPDMKILVLGVFPRSGKSPKDLKDPSKVMAEELHKKVPEINKLVSKLADGKSVHYLDIGGKFLDSEGSLPKEIMPDFLHLSGKGYQIWADAIKSQVGDLLK